MTTSKMSAENLDALSIELDGLDLAGLNLEPLRPGYLMQYKGSLVGKHYKQIVQTLAFRIRKYVDEDHFAVWKAVGNMSALMWYTEIRDMTEYLVRVTMSGMILAHARWQARLDVAINNVMDLFAKIDSRKIKAKIKLHHIAHAPEDVRRFGPLIGRITETFESANAPFRATCIFSNRQAPSRDSARQLGGQETLRHVASGGCWFEGGESRRAGASLLAFFKKHKIVRRFLGWSVKDLARPGGAIPPWPWVMLNPMWTGEVVVIPKKRHASEVVAWKKTQAAAAAGVAAVHDDESLWLPGMKVHATLTKDICCVGSWVMARGCTDVSC
jgi:hypothetical protein